jgi:hypothetical protein
MIKTIQIPDFPFPVFLKSHELKDNELKNKLPLELFLKHEGYEVIIKNERYFLGFPRLTEQPKDTINLRTITYENGTHIYGTLALPEIGFKLIKTGEYCSYQMPNILREVILQRYYNQDDLFTEVSNYENLRKHIQRGDMINKFDRLEEVVTRGKFIAKKYFPDFKLQVVELM